MIPDVVALVASVPAARSQGCSRHPEEVMQEVKSNATSELIPALRKLQFHHLSTESQMRPARLQ
jgi:hypothetical protein